MIQLTLAKLLTLKVAAVAAGVAVAGAGEVVTPACGRGGRGAGGSVEPADSSRRASWRRPR